MSHYWHSRVEESIDSFIVLPKFGVIKAHKAGGAAKGKS